LKGGRRDVKDDNGNESEPEFSSNPKKRIQYQLESNRSRKFAVQVLIIAAIVLEIIAIFAVLFMRFNFDSAFRRAATANLWIGGFVVVTVILLVLDVMAWNPHWSFCRLVTHMCTFVLFTLSALVVGVGLKATNKRIRKSQDRDLQ